MTTTLQRPDERTLPQLTRHQVYAVWAAAALPMGALSFLVAPALAAGLDGPHALTRSLLVCMTAGLVWQALLVLVLVGREQGSLRWPILRDALWLRAPRSPRTGRRGGRMWWVLLPLTVAFAAKELVPGLPLPASRDLGAFMASDGAEQLLHGAWGWFALIVVMALANTVVGEELLFRGYLLPRMDGAFGDRDWVVNGVLFGLYHLHVPWSIPKNLLDTLILAYPAKRYRSAWVGIAVHSGQSLFIVLGTLALVL